MNYFLPLMIAGALFVSISSFGQQPSARTLLHSHTNEITSTRQNVIEKRDVAIELCEAILAVTDPTIEDVPMFTKYITLADPRMLEGRLKGPAEVFPAVRKLVEIGPAVAGPVIDSVVHPHANQQQLSINIAYVLTQTLGPEEGLKLIQGRTSAEERSEDILERVRAILSSQVELSAQQRQAEE